MSSNRTSRRSGRRAWYCVGMGLSAVGVPMLLFAMAAWLMPGGNPAANGAPGPATACVGVVGLSLVFIGFVLMAAGACGVPPTDVARAMELVSDRRVDGAQEHGHADDSSETRVRIRCRACRSLNDENVDTCAECGRLL